MLERILLLMEQKKGSNVVDANEFARVLRTYFKRAE